MQGSDADDARRERLLRMFEELERRWAGFDDEEEA
jgi:hypothetical protein